MNRCLGCELNDCSECEDYISLGTCCCGILYDPHHGEFDDWDDSEPIAPAPYSEAGE